MASQNIYAISDLHGNLPTPPGDADVILLAGDICPDFRPSARNHWDMVDKGGAQQAYWLETTFRDWIEHHGVRTVAIWGNHDFVGEHSFLVPDLPWTLLKDELAVVGDVSIWGTPWVPGLPYWAFHASDEALQACAEGIPEGVDILMSHGPPHGLGDFIPTGLKQREKYGNHTGLNVGDTALRAELPRIRPLVLVCGHIHEARGGYYDRESGTVVANVAAVDENYALHRDPWVRIV